METANFVRWIMQTLKTSSELPGTGGDGWATFPTNREMSSLMKKLNLDISGHKCYAFPLKLQHKNNHHIHGVLKASICIITVCTKTKAALHLKCKNQSTVR